MLALNGRDGGWGSWDRPAVALGLICWCAVGGLLLLLRSMEYSSSRVSAVLIDDVTERPSPDFQVGPLRWAVADFKRPARPSCLSRALVVFAHWSAIYPLAIARAVRAGRAAGLCVGSGASLAPSVYSVDVSWWRALPCPWPSRSRLEGAPVPEAWADRAALGHPERWAARGGWTLSLGILLPAS